MIEIGKDFSVQVTFGEEEQLVNRVFDHVHLFRPIGHSIVKLVTTEGFQQWHMPIETGERVADAAGIIPTERVEITEREWAGYLRFQDSQLNDSWLDQ
jgi:hypothetical protein